MLAPPAPPGWRPPIDAAEPASPPPGWRPPRPPEATAEPHRTAQLLSGSTLLVLAAIAVGACGQAYITHLAHRADTTSNSLINDGILLTLLLYAVVAALIVGYRSWTGHTLRWHEGDPLAASRAGALRGLAMALVVTLGVRAAVGHFAGDPRFGSILAENNPLRTMFVIGLAVVIAPIVEETLFRGILLETWRRLGIGALLLSGLAFAAWHLNGSAIVYYWVIGLILGRVYLRRGLVGSVSAHATFNAVVTAVTIATVLGGGHTYKADGLRVHAPAGWKSVSTKVTGTLDLQGPSGAEFAILSRDRATALSPQQLKATTDAELQSLVNRFGVDSNEAHLGTADLPIGHAVTISVDQGVHHLQMYLLNLDRASYAVLVDTASSKRAETQLPGMLRSLAADN